MLHDTLTEAENYQINIEIYTMESSYIICSHQRIIRAATSVLMKFCKLYTLQHSELHKDCER